MIKKYEFDSQEVAYEQLKANPDGRGFLIIEGAENAKDMGHWPITPAVFKIDSNNEIGLSSFVEVSPAVLSEKYLVDVMWLKEPPAHLGKYEVNPNNPRHNFARRIEK